MRIFIGCSYKLICNGEEAKSFQKKPTKEQKDIISKSFPELVAKSLEDHGHFVERWWEGNTLEYGGALLSNLLAVTKSCNGSVLIFGPDQKTSSNKWLTGGNTLIEYGMCVSQNGPNQTFVISHKNVKIPTDIRDIKFPESNMKECDAAIKETVIFFRKAEEKYVTQHNEVELLVNNEIAQDIIEKKYQRRAWGSRVLYIGSEAAAIWSNIEEEDSYPGRKELQLIEKLFNKCKGDKKNNLAKTDNIVSLGAGSGEIDSEIISYLSMFTNHKILNYIPVDINPYLAILSSKRVSDQFTNISAPFTIIDDFLKHGRLICNVLKNRLQSRRQMELFMMLGGTFANLDSREHTTLINLSSWMTDEDLFLLDVFIKNKNYSFEKNDFRATFTELSDDEKKLIANGLQNQSPKMKSLEINEIAGNLSDYILTKVEEGVNSLTNIDETTLVRYQSKHNRKLLFSVKRYNYDLFKSYLDNFFEVIASQNGFEIFKDDSVSKGVFLLRKKK